MKSNDKETNIQALARQLGERFPNAAISLDEAEKPGGTGFLDMDNEGHHVVVQWKEGIGFGISCAPELTYGEGPDEVYQAVEAAYGRIVSLLLSRTHTSPPESVRIAELRRERGISQEHLAGQLNVKQAAISKFERRSDVLVSSVRDVIRSMGGELRIIAKFPDGTERTLEFEETPNTPKPSPGPNKLKP